MLEKAFNYFSDHFEELLKEHPEEYVVIIDEEIIGFAETEKEAFEIAADYELGTFFIKQITKDALKPIRLPLTVVI